MRILMTADGIGGVWQHALSLARGLRGKRVEIHLVVFGGPLSPAKRREVEACGNVRRIESNLRLEWMDNPWTDVRKSGQLLRRVAGQCQPSLIHLNGYALAAEPIWNAPVVIGAHSCVLSWWQAVRRESAPSAFARYRTKVAAGLAAADCVATPTTAMLDDLRRIYGRDFPGVVIRNGIEPAGFHDGPKKPRILTAGRLWDEAKNIRLLDSIAADVAWPIFAAGSTASPEGGELDFPALRLLGALSTAALRREMSHASIYAAPARYEPFGLAILEAALSGCALVLADIPSLRELWGNCALFVDPFDPLAWRVTLNSLIADADSRAALACRARSRARHFTDAAMAGEYYELYQRLAAHAQETPSRIAA